MTYRDAYPLVIETPLPGALRLGVAIEAGEITSIDFLPTTAPVSCDSATLSQRVRQVIADYFDAAGDFSPLPLLLRGTPFQCRVWRALQQIPCGRRVTYGALANELQSSARAVAGACRANPIPLLIPCHRVIAANGLGGYMGATEGDALALKRWLLRHEGAL